MRNSKVIPFGPYLFTCGPFHSVPSLNDTYRLPSLVIQSFSKQVIQHLQITGIKLIRWNATESISSNAAMPKVKFLLPG